MWNKRLNAHETQIRSLKTASAKGGIRAAAILSSAQVLTLRLFFLFPPGSSLPPSFGAPPPPAPSASPGLPQVLGGRPGVGRARARRLARDQYRLHQGHSSRGSRPLASLPPPPLPLPRRPPYLFQLPPQLFQLSGRLRVWRPGFISRLRR